MLYQFNYLTTKFLIKKNYYLNKKLMTKYNYCLEKLSFASIRYISIHINSSQIFKLLTFLSEKMKIYYSNQF